MLSRALSQHVDCVTRAGGPGTESGSRARAPWFCSHHAPVARLEKRMRWVGLGDQLKLDDASNSKIADSKRNFLQTPLKYLVRLRVLYTCA